MATAFTSIIEGKGPQRILWETETHCAFVTNRPTKEGHMLVIPKKEHDYLFDMDSLGYQTLMDASFEVAQLLEKVFQPKRVAMFVSGFEVPHVHIHLIPLHEPEPGLVNAQKTLTQEEMIAIEDKILHYIHHE